MIVQRRRSPLRRFLPGLIAVVAIGLLWWQTGYEWLVAPGTYHLPTIYLLIAIITSSLHTLALYKFHHILNTTKAAEQAGLLSPGSTIYAYNQQFRYIVRASESLFVYAIAIILFVSVSHPQLLLNKYYGRLIIFYFLGTLCLTGYLTYRDLETVKQVKGAVHLEGEGE